MKKQEQHRLFMQGLTTLGLVLSISVVPTSVQAVNWNCTNGFWGTVGCWNPSGVLPTNTDLVNAYTVSGSDTTLKIDGFTGNAFAQTLKIDATAGTTVTLKQSGGNLSTGSEYIGGSGAGFFTQTGGTHTVTFSLRLGTNSTGKGTYNLNGGMLNIGGNIENGSGNGIFNFNAGTLNIGGNLLLDSTTPFDSNLVLSGVKTMIIGGTTTLSGFNTLTVDGGTFSTDSLVNNGGFAFNSGTFNLTNGNLVIGTGGLFGGLAQFNIGQTVNVTRRTTVNSGSILALNNSSFNSGTINNSGQIALDGFVSSLGGGTFNNSGMLTGSGQISTSLQNLPSGEVRVNSGDALVFTGLGNSNNNRISLLGGSVNFTQGLTNDGLIAGHGTFAIGATVANGLRNIGYGSMAFSGNTDILGDISNLDASSIIISGGATATFYDDVAHNGAEIRVSTGSQAVFFGAVSGSGAYTGTGTVFFEGDLLPGNSPSLISVEGDMTLGLLSTTTMELGGLLRGTEYDAFDIGGTLSLSGELNVVLFDLGSGLFAPSLGDSFDLFAADAITGNFDLLTLAVLGGNLDWRLDYLVDEIGTIDIARLSIVSSVPVPPSVWLFGSGLLGLVGIARRRMPLFI